MKHLHKKGYCRNGIKDKLKKAALENRKWKGATFKGYGDSFERMNCCVLNMKATLSVFKHFRRIKIMILVR